MCWVILHVGNIDQKCRGCYHILIAMTRTSEPSELFIYNWTVDHLLNKI